jgi:uncharacterized protein YbjT (DUF2867 family)
VQTWDELLRQSARRSGSPRVFGRGDNPINFVSVHDVADALVHATLDPSLRGQRIDVGGPASLTLNELARQVQESSGGDGSLRHVPRSALRALGTIARPLNPTLARLARTAVAMDSCDLSFDPAVSIRAHPLLSCSPVVTDGTLARDG